MKIAYVVGALCSATALVGGGVAVGVYLVRNFEIVKIGPQEGAAASETAEPSMLDRVWEHITTPMEEGGAGSLPAAAEGHQGPFSYQFIPGEELVYRLSSRMGGAGFDSGTPGEIGLTMNANLSLLTESVDPSGNGRMRVEFGETKISGNFMGSPVDMYRPARDTTLEMDGRQVVDTQAEKGIAGNSQLEFFRQPIHITVARDGTVVDVSGAPGFDQLLSPSKVLSMISFPSGDLPTGYHWKSDINLPVPGLGIPAPAQLDNTLIGYQVMNGRNCGVIEQLISARQTDGTAAAVADALGDAMNFTMPEFDLAGRNLVHFDIENGKLVHSEMNLEFNLELGEESGAVTTLLNLYGDLLNDVEGRKPGGEDAPSLLKLGVTIASKLSLVG